MIFQVANKESPFVLAIFVSRRELDRLVGGCGRREQKLLRQKDSLCLLSGYGF